MKQSKRHVALHLHRTGSAFRETIVVFTKLTSLIPWEEAKQTILEEGILQKGSRVTEIGIIHEIRRRYLFAPQWLPDALHLREFLLTSIPQRAKYQALFVYTYHADYVIQKVFRKIIIPNITQNCELRNSIIVEYLSQLKDETGVNWSLNTIRVWTKSLKTMLREVGFLKHDKVTKPYVQPETFAFFLLWLFYKLRALKKVLEHRALTPLCLDDEDETYLLKKGNEKGWWYYTKGGGVIEFIPKTQNLREWIHALE